MKQCIIIAGPNGAGKTTFANNFLPFEAKTLAFINADLIAQGLSPFAPERVAIEASKILIFRIKELCRINESFALESTLSGKAHLRLILELREQGYFVVLHFLKLASIELAIERVKIRVMDGGHNIPEDVIRRRFKRALINLPEYKSAVNKWKIWDTSSGTPELIDEN